MEYVLTAIAGVVFLVASFVWLMKYHQKSEGYAYQEDLNKAIHMSWVLSATGGVLIGVSLVLSLIA